MKKDAFPTRHRLTRPLLLITGILLLFLIEGYFIGGMVVRNKVDEALRSLLSSLEVQYSRLHTNVLTGSMDMEGVQARYMPESDHQASDHTQEVSVNKIAISGFSVFSWLRSRRLRIRNIRLEGVIVHADAELLEKDSGLQQMKPPPIDMLIGQPEVSGLTVEEMLKGKKQLSMEADLELDSVTRDTVAGILFVSTHMDYMVPGAAEAISLRHLVLDSRRKLLRIDTAEIRLTTDRGEIGRLKGHQVDVARAEARGIE
jgi:hypothetical protein